MQARCIAADNISQEYLWNGGAPVTLDSISGTHACYLTGISGDWSGSNSEVVIYDFDSPAQLTGSPSASGVGTSATARCIDIALTSAAPPFLLDPGSSGRLVMRRIETGCFYRLILGPFYVPIFGPPGGRVDMLAETIDGQLRWTAGVGGASGGGTIFCDDLTP